MGVLVQRLLHVSRGTIERQPGRTFVLLIGTGMIGGSFWTPTGGDPFATTVLWLGTGLVGAAGLMPWIESLAIGPQGMSLQSREKPFESTRVTSESEELPEGENLSSSSVVERARVLAAEAALSALLQPTTGVLHGHRFHLYMWDSDAEALMPVFETGHDPEILGFEFNQGATGEAFAREEYVRVIGDDVSNEVHHLNDEHRERYKNLRVVAAAPVLNASEEAIAVLSASSEAQDDPLGTEDGYFDHVSRAAQVARVLVDLLKWEAD